MDFNLVINNIWKSTWELDLPFKNKIFSSKLLHFWILKHNDLNNDYKTNKIKL